VITCPYGELLLDGITQTNLGDGVTDSDIQTFYTWNDMSIPPNRAFVTLQFPNNSITPTKVVVYCLELQNLEAHAPREITLYSSTTDSIFPDNEIQNVRDDNYVVTKSGSTPQDDVYEYRRYNLTIPLLDQISLNYLCIELGFEGMHWVFISEVEVYHMYEPCKLILFYAIYLAIFFTVPTTMLMQTTTLSIMASPTVSSSPIMISTTMITSCKLVN